MTTEEVTEKLENELHYLVLGIAKVDEQYFVKAYENDGAGVPVMLSIRLKRYVKNETRHERGFFIETFR